MSVSVLILTLNEECNLPSCLESVSWSDDIVVFDSFSVDRTVEIANSKGIRVIQRKFDNWSSHQNWAVCNIEFQHPWVFYIDADERCDAQLRADIQRISDYQDCISAIQVRRKDYFMGKWLKHAQLYPTWFTRIFRPEKIRYERLVNPIAIVDGSVGRINGHLIHYPFSHGITHWFTRHNRYSDLEAIEKTREITIDNDWAGMFSKDVTRRRMAMKRMAYGLPCRPALTWIYLMFGRFAFLDGLPGLNYSIMRAIYEYMIDLKVKELRRREKGLPI